MSDTSGQNKPYGHLPMPVNEPRLDAFIEQAIKKRNGIVIPVKSGIPEKRACPIESGKTQVVNRVARLICSLVPFPLNDHPAG